MTVYTIMNTGLYSISHLVDIYATDEVAKKDIHDIYEKLVSQYEGDDNWEAVLNDDKNEVNTYFQGDGPVDTWKIEERQVIE